MGTILIDLAWSHAHPGTCYSDQHLDCWVGARGGISPPASCGPSWRNGFSKENQDALTKQVKVSEARTPEFRQNWPQVIPVVTGSAFELGFL